MSHYNHLFFYNIFHIFIFFFIFFFITYFLVLLYLYIYLLDLSVLYLLDRIYEFHFS